MTELDLERLRHGQAAERFHGRAVALLPIGSTEPHGPHLPLDTDTVLARARARRAAELFHERGVDALVLPALPYGVARLAQDYGGGITLRPGTLWAFVEDLVISLQQDGIRQLVLVNAHHEAEHLRILTNLAVDFCERGRGRCEVLFPDAPTLGGGLLEEFDCHGGREETSLMLAAAPDLVDDEVRRTLAPVELDLPDAVPGQSRSLVDLGIRDAYLGAPAEATAQEGAELLDRLAGLVVDRCARAWPDLFRPDSRPTLGPS